jgi:hypothetical protein
LGELAAEQKREVVFRQLAMAAVEEGDFEKASAAMDRWEVSLDRQALILREPEMLEGRG